MMTEDYQLPYWVSYVAFAVATIFLGGILGLILVCCIDCIFPPRREDSQHKQTREDKKDSDVEDDDEDIEEIDNDSQDEAENLSQDEDGELSQEEEQSQEEDSPKVSDNKARKRRTRKTD